MSKDTGDKEKVVRVDFQFRRELAEKVHHPLGAEAGAEGEAEEVEFESGTA